MTGLAAGRAPTEALVVDTDPAQHHSHSREPKSRAKRPQYPHIFQTGLGPAASIDGIAGIIAPAPWCGVADFSGEERN
jgi:hypothetical protein